MRVWMYSMFDSIMVIRLEGIGVVFSPVRTSHNTYHFDINLWYWCQVILFLHMPHFFLNQPLHLRTTKSEMKAGLSAEEEKKTSKLLFLVVVFSENSRKLFFLQNTAVPRLWFAHHCTGSQCMGGRRIAWLSSRQWRELPTFANEWRTERERGWRLGGQFGFVSQQKLFVWLRKTRKELRRDWGKKTYRCSNFRKFK